MIHQYRIDGKGGIFAEDTPVLDRGEVRMHGDGAPELQLRSGTAEPTTALITVPTIETYALISLPSCHVRLSWKALGDGDDRWTTNDGSRESGVDRLMRAPSFPHLNGSF